MCPHCAEPTVVVEAIVHGRPGFLTYDPDLKKQHRQTCARAPSEGLKRCARCDRRLPTSSFGEQKNGRLRSYCRECEAEAAREHRAWKPPSDKVGQPA